jgi:hypothetical protein
MNMSTVCLPFIFKAVTESPMKVDCKSTNVQENVTGQVGS